MQAATLDTEETSTVVKSKVVVQDSFDPRWLSLLLSVLSVLAIGLVHPSLKRDLRACQWHPTSRMQDHLIAVDEVVDRPTFSVRRSMRQLKKEYQQLKAAKAAAAAGLCLVDSGDDGGEEIEEYDDPSGNDTESEAEELTAALDGLCIRGPEVGSKVLLRGVPVAKVYHLLLTMFLLLESCIIIRYVSYNRIMWLLSWHSVPFAGWTPTVRGRR